MCRKIVFKKRELFYDSDKGLKSEKQRDRRRERDKIERYRIFEDRIVNISRKKVEKRTGEVKNSKKKGFSSEKGKQVGNVSSFHRFYKQKGKSRA